MLRSAATDPNAAALLSEFVVHEIALPVTAALGRPDGDLRAGLVASQLVDVAVVRHVPEVEPLASVRGERSSR